MTQEQIVRRLERISRADCAHRPICIGRLARTSAEELDCTGCGDYLREPILVESGLRAQSYGSVYSQHTRRRGR